MEAGVAVGDEPDDKRASQIFARTFKKRAELGAGVNAPGTVATELHIQPHRKPREKSMDTQKFISDAISKNRLCGMLNPDELSELTGAMEFFAFGAGDVIIKQGEAGSYFFILHSGQLDIFVGERCVNTMERGKGKEAFGELALLHNCPRSATVVAKVEAGIWGADGKVFREVLRGSALRGFEENRRFIDKLKLFEGLAPNQKDRVGEAAVNEVLDAGARFVSRGDSARCMYFVKKGKLRVEIGGEGGASTATVYEPGDCFGERGFLYDEQPQTVTLEALERCELLNLNLERLKEVLGDDLSPILLQRNLLLNGLKKSVVFSQFSSSQQFRLVKAMELCDLKAYATVAEAPRFLLVTDGTLQMVQGAETKTMTSGHWYEKDDGGAPASFTAGEGGCHVALLTATGLDGALRELGITMGSGEQTFDYARRRAMAMKIYIFRHLSEQQIDLITKGFQLQSYLKGAKVIQEGEYGSQFFVILSGEVQVVIGTRVVRNMGKNAWFGERALLFDEPRTATIEVSSDKAEFWTLDKEILMQVVKGKMLQQLMHRISLQDTMMNIKDLKCIKIIGEGAAGVVRLVQHKKSNTRYALKRVRKVNGKMPKEVKRETELLAENDHPFIMYLVKTFETPSSVYMLTELITGGELHAAIRSIPTVLSQGQAMFYIGSLVLAVETLHERNVVFRDLKPENVMLDSHGYLKLIDFGIAKKLEANAGKTFTMIGTPHYMAPEVVRGKGYGPEVDIWGIGVILYELICGYLPFADDKDDAMDVCREVLDGKVSYPNFINSASRFFLHGLLARQVSKRLGCGLGGFEDIKSAQFFQVEGNEKLIKMASGGTPPKGSNYFDLLLGRELEPPVMPKGETYVNPADLASEVCSDDSIFK